MDNRGGLPKQEDLKLKVFVKHCSLIVLDKSATNSKVIDHIRDYKMRVCI